MNIAEISTTVGRKVQIEDFEPFNISNTLTAELKKSDDLDECAEELAAQAKEYTQREIVRRVAEKEMKDELEG